MKRFPLARAALAVYAAGQPTRDAQCDNICTNADVVEWERVEAEAWELVQRAFHADTQTVNNWDHCKHLSRHGLRSMLKRIDGDQS